MPRKCSVISCSSLKENPDITLFRAPTCTLDSWKEVIYRVNGGDKRKVTYVCSKHFTSDDLITSYTSLPTDIANVSIQYNINYRYLTVNSQFAHHTFLYFLLFKF